MEAASQQQDQQTLSDAPAASASAPDSVIAPSQATIQQLLAESQFQHNSELYDSSPSPLLMGQVSYIDGDEATAPPADSSTLPKSDRPAPTSDVVPALHRPATPPTPDDVGANGSTRSHQIEHKPASFSPLESSQLVEFQPPPFDGAQRTQALQPMDIDSVASGPTVSHFQPANAPRERPKTEKPLPSFSRHESPPSRSARVLPKVSLSAQVSESAAAFASESVSSSSSASSTATTAALDSASLLGTQMPALEPMTAFEPDRDGDAEMAAGNDATQSLWESQALLPTQASQKLHAEPQIRIAPKPMTLGALSPEATQSSLPKSPLFSAPKRPAVASSASNANARSTFSNTSVPLAAASAVATPQSQSNRAGNSTSAAKPASTNAAGRKPCFRSAVLDAEEKASYAMLYKRFITAAESKSTNFTGQIILLMFTAPEISLVSDSMCSCSVSHC